MRRLALTAALALGLATTTGTACPVCTSGTGGQVRAGIVDGHFGATLLATLLPFPVFAAIVAFIYFGPPWPRRPGNGDGGAEA